MITYTFKNFTELSAEESQDVLTQRNDEFVRRWMTNDCLISSEEHMRFIASLKNAKDKLYLRVERCGQFVGVYSLTDMHCGTAIGGFWITSYARERLLSLNVVFKSIDFVFQVYQLNSIRGCYLSNNKAAKRLNNLLGFMPTSSPKNQDPRMTYLELTRSQWVQSISKQVNLLKLIEVAESRNEN